ncbi:MAG: MaoC family dehydratase [Candidatus Helarchaeota archaeon]|nr:MaoC family dehydratase [Candidatus Helarchaeota archaeon]
MAKLTLKNIIELKQYLGKELGISDWHLVTQKEINLFADATGDHQWIHVDVERAKKESPYKGPIAHGYYTLSLAPVLLAQILEVKEKKMGINYGTEKVRFPAPVPVGKKVRAKAVLASLQDIEGGVQANFQLTFEVEGQPKPACVAEVVYRYYS